MRVERSLSRGRVTIRLSNSKEHNEENAEVTVEVREPEKMMEKVVSQLAQQFSPDSRVTVDARICDTESSHDMTGKATMHRLLKQEVHVKDNEDNLIKQCFVVSPDLDRAIPIAPDDQHVRLVTGVKVPVDPANVVECIYSRNGFLTQVNTPFGNSEDKLEALKPGLATFTQVVVIASALENAVPIVLGQKLIHLQNGDVYYIQPEDIYAVFFAEKGLAAFYGCLSDGSVRPGIPEKKAVCTAVVPFRLSGEEAIPMALSTAYKALTASDKYINVSVYDETGSPLCWRTPTGVLQPGVPDVSGVIHKLQYVWVSPAQKSEKSKNFCGIMKITPHCGSLLLSTNEIIENPNPEDIAVIFLNKENKREGGFINDRKPSLILGDLDEFLPKIGSCGQFTEKLTGVSTRDESHQYYSNRVKEVCRPPYRRLSEGTSICDSASELNDTLISRRQAYFRPTDIDYAIPLAPGQTRVKLVDGVRIPVDITQTFVVVHDQRGFPLYTHFPDGEKRPWAVKLPGVGIKAQDFLVDQELLYAVPIEANQSEVLVNDGGHIEVSEENIITVYYDATGKPTFTYVGRRRRIKPGIAAFPGVATSVQYFWLIDCHDDTDEQFVVPVTGYQEETPSPRDPNNIIAVDRSNLTVVFYNDYKEPLYTQLASGSLVCNGLTSLNSETKYLGYQRVPRSSDAFSEDSRLGVLSINRRDHWTIASSRTGRKEVIERQVPVKKIEYVDKIVEVPEIKVIEKHVEVEKIEYVTKYVKKPKYVERPVEHVKYVPKIETKMIERLIKVPQIVEVERPEIIEQKVNRDNFVDEEEEVIVATNIIPVIRNDVDLIEDIECLRIEPELVPVDVYVPKLVRGKLQSVGMSKQIRRQVDVTLGHYNSLVLKLNPQLGENYERLPLLKTPNGSFPMLNRDAVISTHQATDDEVLEFLRSTGFVR